jgi:hypothetical protein
MWISDSLQACDGNGPFTIGHLDAPQNRYDLFPFSTLQWHLLLPSLMTFSLPSVGAGIPGRVDPFKAGLFPIG